jgi:hypothetical protein
MLSADSTDDGGWNLGLKVVAVRGHRRCVRSFIPNGGDLARPKRCELLNPPIRSLTGSVDRPCKLGIKIDALPTSPMLHPSPFTEGVF